MYATAGVQGSVMICLKKLHGDLCPDWMTISVFFSGYVRLLTPEHSRVGQVTLKK